VVAPQAEARDLAHSGFGAAAGAVKPVIPLLDGLRIGLGSYRFSNALLLIGFVFGAGTKFDGAIAVVVFLHGETA
jgi:hypothetical protein